MTKDEIVELLKERAAPYARNKGTTGIFGFCNEHNIAHAHVSDWMRGRRGAPPTVLLDALGLEWRIVPKEDAPAVPQEMSEYGKNDMGYS